MRPAAFPKICGCGARYDRAAYLALPAPPRSAGLWPGLDADDVWIIRNCTATRASDSTACMSTLLVVVPRASSAALAAVKGPHAAS